MEHNKYWQERFELLEESLLKQGLDTYNDIEKQYRLSMNEIEKDITVWYKRLAKNNNISFAAAKTLLNTNELKEFRWTVEEYIERGKENAVDQRWMKELENASAKVHISRLEAMKLQTQQHLEVLYGNQLDSIDKTMRNIYSDGYYRGAFEVQKGLGVGYSFQRLDESRINKVIAKPWAADGRNFSDRVWSDKDKLVNNLHISLTQATVRGDPLDKMIRDVAEKMSSSRSAAGRLVMTESAFFASASQRDCFNSLDVEQYEILATLDSRTSPVCREMDGKVFAMSDFKAGITAPPFHCWCRSCTIPYFDDNKGSRAARGKDGKTYHVPADMKYDEWFKTQQSDIIKEKTLQEKIQEIKDYTKGSFTELDIKSAGKMVCDDLALRRKDCKDRLGAAKSLYESYGWDALTAEKNKLKKVNRGLIDPKELGYGSKEEAFKRFKEVEKLLNNLIDNKDMHNAYYKMMDIKREYQGEQSANILELKEKLLEIRALGNNEKDILNHLGNSKSSMTKVVLEAYQVYPKEWIEKSIGLGKLKPKKVDRGYYNGVEIAISGNGDKALATAIHELGHRFEKAVPAILEMEKLFYKRRTKDEELIWLGGNYSRSEKTRKDDFINAYMGKDYGGFAYELVSMGFQYAYTNPTELWKDEDMAHWIYGILILS